MTSRIDWELVSSMTSRSMPMPRPPVGGMPCSSAVRKSSSICVQHKIHSMYPRWLFASAFHEQTCPHSPTARVESMVLTGAVHAP